MRKFFSLFFISLTGVLSTIAQSDAGWYKYPIFNDNINSIVETSTKVYYLSGTNLFSFNPEDNENYAYSSINKLTGDAITNLYYNLEKEYLLIVYDDCNMDILYDDGKLINLPEIRDAKNISSTKGINDVAFANDRIALATTFGLVIYDDNKMEVKESGIYNRSIDCLAIMNDHLFIHYIDDSKNYVISYSPLNQRHNSLDKFQFLTFNSIDQLIPLDNNTLLARDRGSHQLKMAAMDFNNSTLNFNRLDFFTDNLFKKFQDGYYTTNGTDLITTSATQVKSKPLPELLHNQVIGMRYQNEVWAGDSDGIAKYDISESTPVLLYDKLFYSDAITCSRVGTMKWSADGKRLYISNFCASQWRSWNIGEFIDEYQTTNVIENGFPFDVSLKSASATQKQSIQYQQNNNNKRLYGDPLWVVEDPDDADKYYCATNLEGVYVIKYNETSGEYEELGKYTYENAPIFGGENIGSRTQNVNIDPAGNLWVGYLLDESCFSILPADKRKQDPNTITKNDWIVHKKLGVEALNHKDVMSMFCKQSNMAFFCSAKGEHGFVAVDTKGTYADPSDDTVVTWPSMLDQDGNTYSAPDRTTFLVEDKRGCVWVGTSAGVYEITSPVNATNSSMKIRRIKVPRNDGTNYADYLLDSDVINWIAVDHSDRKWIATQDSGIFLVSETGDKIILNFTTDNSPLPTNCITSVECDTENNTVYIGTEYGLYSYLSDSSPAHLDFTEVYAYPNPVRYNEAGDVTIAGLMENTIVKIADTAGRVVYQTRSEGGMATWPVTNQAGKRVKTGVYYIFTLSYNNETSKGAAAKILVIN